MAMPFVSHKDLAEELCKAVGVDPDRTYRVIVDVKCNDVVHVYVEMIGTNELLDVDWVKGLQGAEITVVNE